VPRALGRAIIVRRSGLSEDRLPKYGRREELEHAPSDELVDGLGHDRQLVARAAAGTHVALRVGVARAGEHPTAAGAAEDEPHEQVLGRRVAEGQPLRVQEHGPDVVPCSAADRPLPYSRGQRPEDPSAWVGAVLAQAGDARREEDLP